MLIQEFAQSNMRVYILLILLSAFLVLLSRQWKRKGFLSDSLRRICLLLLAFLGIIIAELILYAKSGMYGRYLVPFTVGICLLNAVLISEWVKKRLYHCIWLCCMFLVVALLYRSVWMNGGVVYTAGEPNLRLDFS